MSTRSPAPDRPAVAVRNLTKRYGSGEGAVRALDGVSFEVGRGEVVGLLGPNGAGKTTCIKSLLGLVLPTTGTVEVDGVDVHDDPRGAHRRIAAMLEGARNVYWRLTPRENLRFFAALAGGDPDRREHHDALLDRLGVGAKVDDQVKELSRGQKQKVALACTLARDVEVAVLDEPTLGLDVESSLSLRRELRTLVAEEGLTVLLSSHDMDVIEDLCDRVVVLQDGGVVADERVEALVDVFRTQAYRLTVAGAVPEAVRDRLAAAFGATDWQAGPERTRFRATLDGDADLYDLLGTLREHDRRVEGVESVDPDLEEVFLELTSGGGNGTGNENGGERRVEQ